MASLDEQILYGMYLSDDYYGTTWRISTLEVESADNMVTFYSISLICYNSDWSELIFRRF